MLELEKDEWLAQHVFIFVNCVRKIGMNLLPMKITKSEKQICFFAENVLISFLAIRNNENSILMKSVKDVKEKKGIEG
jgi:hypothetical protein